MMDITFRKTEIYCYFNTSYDADCPLKVSGVLDLFKIPHALRYDFDFTKKGNAHLTIQGALLAIKFLDKMLEHAEWFAKICRGTTKEQLKSVFAGYVLDEVSNPSSAHSAEDQIYLNDHLSRILDHGYQTLKEDPAVTAIEFLNTKFRPVVSGQHYLAHPYYQLMVAFHISNQMKVNQYNAASLFTRFSQVKPDENIVQYVADRHNLIPAQFKRDYYKVDFKLLQAEVDKQLSVQEKRITTISQRGAAQASGLQDISPGQARDSERRPG